MHELLQLGHSIRCILKNQKLSSYFPKLYISYHMYDTILTGLHELKGKM